MNEIVTRALSGAVYVVLLVFCALFSKLTFFFLFTLFLSICLHEFSKMIKYKYSYIFIVLGFLFSLAFFLLPLYPSQFIYLSVGAVISNLILLYNLFSNQQFLKVHKKYNLLFLYITIPFLLLLLLPKFFTPENYRVVIALFVLIWSNDTFAYLSGRMFGKTKLFERVSPKKTIEGLIGGVVLTLLFSVVLSYFFSFMPLIIWVGTAILVSVFGTLGDLVESQFKREVNVKDSGSIMPGHGGLLDRLDSVIFVLPFVFLFYIIYFYYV